MIYDGFKDGQSKEPLTIITHVGRLEHLINGNWQHYQSNGDVSHIKDAKVKQDTIVTGIRQYLTGASFNLFSSVARPHFGKEAVI